MVTSSQRAARSDETRARLIEAGPAPFAARGCDDAATRVPAQRAEEDQAALAGLVEDVAHALIGMFVGHRDGRRPYMAFLMRDYTTAGATFAHLCAWPFEPMHRAVAVVATAAGDLPREHSDGIMAVCAYIRQILAFAGAGTPLLPRMGWDGYSAERVDRVAAAVVPMALAAFGLERSEDE